MNECLNLDINFLHEYCKEKYGTYLEDCGAGKKFPDGSIIRIYQDEVLLNFGVRFPEVTDTPYLCRVFMCGKLDDYIIWLENRLKDKNQ